MSPKQSSNYVYVGADFNSPSPCFVCVLRSDPFLFSPVGEIKKKKKKTCSNCNTTKRQHTHKELMHVQSGSDSNGSVLFIPIRVNFIKTWNKETKAINENH